MRHEQGCLTVVMHEWLFLLSVPPPPLKDMVEEMKWAERLRKPKEVGCRLESGITKGKSTLHFCRSYLIQKDTVERIVTFKFNVFFILHFDIYIFASSKTFVVQPLQMLCRLPASYRKVNNGCLLQETEV